MSGNFQPQSDRCWTGLVIYLPFHQTKFIKTNKVYHTPFLLILSLHKEPTHIITNVDDKNIFKNTSLIISVKVKQRSYRENYSIHSIL